MLAVIIEGELIRPSVVGLPGKVAHLKNEIGLSVIADDESQITLPTFALSGQLADVNSAGPIAWDYDLGRGRPRAVL